MALGLSPLLIGDLFGLRDEARRVPFRAGFPILGASGLPLCEGGSHGGTDPAIMPAEHRRTPLA